jgi:Holliday junction resolvase-like predicted endonuclease
VEELNKAGGSAILLQGADNLRKREELVKLLKQGNQNSGEIDIICKYGKKRTIRFVSRPRRDSEGNIIGSLSAIKEVTPAGQPGALELPTT